MINEIIWETTINGSFFISWVFINICKTNVGSSTLYRFDVIISLAGSMLHALWLAENCLPSRTWKLVLQSVQRQSHGCQHSGSTGPSNVQLLQVIESLRSQEFDCLHSVGSGMAGGIFIKTFCCHTLREHHPRVRSMVGYSATVVFEFPVDNNIVHERTKDRNL